MMIPLEGTKKKQKNFRFVKDRRDKVSKFAWHSCLITDLKDLTVILILYSPLGNQ